MSEMILSALLIASLCCTGALFLKWWETKKENDHLQEENMKANQERMEANKKVTELQTYIRQHHRPYVERRTPKVPIEE
jgi:hypothetical protein